MVKNRKIHRRMKVKETSGNKKETRITINLLSISGCFLFFYVPESIGYLLVLLTDLNLEELNRHSYNFHAFANIAATLNCVVDSIAFLCVSSQFRSVSRSILCKCFSTRSNQMQSTTAVSKTGMES